MPGINKYMTTKKLTQEEFIDHCKKIYVGQYNYEKTVYINTRSNVLVECKNHGLFEKNARALMQGNGCKSCNSKWKDYVKSRRMTTEEFIKKASDKHENFYSYNKSNYVNSRTKLIITCPIHGDFEQRSGGHLEGYGCRKCADLKHGDYRPWFIKTYFDRYPEKKNIPAILYLLYNKEENFYKVGITTKGSVEERIKYMSHYTFDIIDKVSDTMYNVTVAEQEILAKATQYKTKKRFRGYTECTKEFINIHKYVPNRVGNPLREG
tara:strand:- start:193 stop:987 length:795 start_codon:yes stop_codon:yes gene_type:complete